MKLISYCLSFGLLLLVFGFTQNSSEDVKWFTKTGRVTFFSKSPLDLVVEDIKAKNNQAVIVFKQNTGDIISQITIKSFIFKKQKMQEHFNENYMESDKYPLAKYVGKINNIKRIDFTKDSTYNVSTTGKLTIHGVTKNITTKGKLKIEGSNATISTNFSVLLKDYNIKKPSIMAKKIADEIKITLKGVCKKKV